MSEMEAMYTGSVGKHRDIPARSIRISHLDPVARAGHLSFALKPGWIYTVLHIGAWWGHRRTCTTNSTSVMSP